MPTKIIYDAQARLKFMTGINKIANAVGVTYGSAGPAVLIQHVADGLTPVFTRDGVTVAKSISCHDRTEDIGARMLRDVAGAVSRQVGDGTTTAIVLAQAISQECMKLVAAGYHPTQLKQGMDIALAVVEKKLQEQAMTGITPDWIEKIAAIATKDEVGVGALLAEAFEKLGTKSPLTFKLGNGREDVLEVVDGIQYDQGYLSPYFVTDKDRNEAVLDNPYILLYDKEISDLMDLVPILEEVNAVGGSLVIIAEDVIDKALSGLLLNQVRGIFKVVALKPPGFGDKRENRLQDLAIMTGGQAFIGDFATKLEHIELAQLGQAKRVIVSADNITIIGGRGDQALIKERINYLAHEAEMIQQRKPGDGSPTGNKHDFEELQERLAILSGKTGVFEVGGTADVEIKERMVRIENAYMSTKAALEEGVMPGGGVGLYNMVRYLDDIIVTHAGQQQGIAIVKQALQRPLQKLNSNAGVNSEVVLARLQAENNPRFAFNTQDKGYGDFLEIGVIDAVKVARLALRNAVSVVGTLITTQVVVMHVPDTSIMDGYSPEWAAATREDPRAD
ncbi:MAG: molecular chaperone GroEL [Methyloprofundus sp.]|nr:molecular chaperone GroEL [Methyloprofundus sp.]